MSVSSQIPRISIIWLLVAQFLVIAPHSLRMSWWMFAIWGLCALWRVSMYRGNAQYPSAWLRGLLVTLGSIGIFVSFGKEGTLDLTVALLILAFSLKLVEVKKRRDVFLVFYLAYIIIAVSFLFSQSLLLTIYHALTVILITSAMVATQQALTGGSARHSIRVAITLFAQAIPIMLVFFLVFPRIDPLWAVPKPERSATTGMSDLMAPGDISKLVQSNKLVFRADFVQSVPSRQDLYWRGLTLSVFDGRSWSPQIDTPSNTVQTQRVNYQQLTRYIVEMEASNQRWLYLLPVASISHTLDALPISNAMQADFSLATVNRINQRRHFGVDSYLSYTIESVLTQARIVDETRLPEKFNPKAREFANNLYRQSAGTEDFVERLLHYFRERPFYYSFEPPKLGTHSVDEFLFKTREGFCEHYASALVFLLRSVGIPSRIVLGYQGGIIDEKARSISVREKDAHAWAEYWMRDSGWIRVDPTSAVAPNRVILGADDGLNFEEIDHQFEFFGEKFDARNLAFLHYLSRQYNGINRNWQQWVVGFDHKNQMLALSALLGNVTPLRTALLVVLTIVVVLALVGLRLHFSRRSPRENIHVRGYFRYCRKVAKLGLVRAVNETPRAFACRVSSDLPIYADNANSITRQFEALVFQELDNKALAREFQAAIKRFPR